MAPSALISGTSHPKITFVTPLAKKFYLPPNVPGRVLKRRPSESSWEHLCRKPPLHAYDSEIRVHAENSVICVLVRKPRIWIQRQGLKLEGAEQSRSIRGMNAPNYACIDIDFVKNVHF